MKTSDSCIHMMHMFEGIRNKPYQCPASLWTIGAGHLMYVEQLRLTVAARKLFPLKPEDDRIFTDEEIDKLFKDDLLRFELGVLRLAPTVAGHQNKFDACVSFSYNLGLGNFQASTLRQKILREDWDAAAKEFLKWTKASGKELAGLVRRRKAESVMFMS